MDSHGAVRHGEAGTGWKGGDALGVVRHGLAGKLRQGLVGEVRLDLVSQRGAGNAGLGC